MEFLKHNGWIEIIEGSCMSSCTVEDTRLDLDMVIDRLTELYQIKHDILTEIKRELFILERINKTDMKHISIIYNKLCAWMNEDKSFYLKRNRKLMMQTDYIKELVEGEQFILAHGALSNLYHTIYNACIMMEYNPMTGSNFFLHGSLL